MKRFFKFLFTTHPYQILLSIFLLIASGMLAGSAAITLVPLIDLLTKPISEASQVTLKISRLMESSGISFSVINVMIVIVVFTSLKNSFLILARKTFLRVQYLLLKDIICDTYGSFFNARWHFFSSNSQGVLGNSLVKEINTTGTAISSFFRLCTDLFRVLFYFALALYVSYKVSLVIICLGVLFVLPFSYLGKTMHRWGKDNTETANKIFETIQETLTAAKLIIGYGQQSKNINSLGESVTAHQDATIKAQLLSVATPLIYEPIALIAIMVAIYVSIAYFKVEVSLLFVVIYSFMRSLPMLINVVDAKNRAINALPSFDQIKRLKDSAEAQAQPSGNRRFTDYNDEIVFKNVNFGYPKHKTILHDINIVIPKGQMVAFVGESGAGKTTLIDMLLGFYEPADGDILIDGISLKEFDILSWRYRLGYVPQDAILFNMSIKDNLLWAKEDASKEEIINACKQANADEFICKLRDGYDTIVGDRGIRLSGGQRQRIALARAILRKPALLILDEATSALDSRSELLIQRAIEKISNRITVVVIAHRLSTIVKADCIYVLDNGSVVEKGTYERLIASKSKFNKLAKLQRLTSPALAKIG